MSTEYEVAATAYRRGEDPKQYGADIVTHAVADKRTAHDMVLGAAASALRLWDDYDDQPADCVLVEVRAAGSIALAGEKPDHEHHYEGPDDVCSVCGDEGAHRYSDDAA